MQQLLLPLNHFFPALYWNMGHIGGDRLAIRIRAALRDDGRTPRHVEIESSSNKAAILCCNTCPLRIFWERRAKFLSCSGDSY